MAVTVAELREALGTLAEGRSDLELLQWLTTMEWIAELAVETQLRAAQTRRDARRSGLQRTA